MLTCSFLFDGLDTPWRASVGGLLYIFPPSLGQCSTTITSIWKRKPRSCFKGQKQSLDPSPNEHLCHIVMTNTKGKKLLKQVKSYL